MSVAPDLRLDVMLNGTVGEYRRVVLAREGLIGYWRLGEPSGVTAVDESDHGHDGTYAGTYSLGQTSLLSSLDTDTAVDFQGQTAYVDLGVVDEFSPDGAFSVEAWCKPLREFINSTNYEIFGNELLNNYGLLFRLESNSPTSPTAGRINARTNQSGTFTGIATDFIPEINLNTVVHCVWTFDGTSGRLYVNGVLQAGPSAMSSPVASPQVTRIGNANPVSPQLFNGIIDEVSFYNRTLTADEIAESYRVRLMGTWTDITDDLELDGGLHFSRGIHGNGPTDCVAGGGTLSFTLDNSVRNGGETAGWYSPNHADCRDGWTFDIPVRLSFIYGSPERMHFRGTVRVIDPDPGIYGAQRVHVEAYDLMRDLIDTDIREIDIAVDQSEDQVIDAVLDLLPAEAMPDDRDLDVGVDSFPYVFDRITPTSKMAEPIADATISSFGLFAVKGDGTPMFRSRHSRAVSTSAYTFEAIRDVVIPSTLDSVFRLVRTSTHPKTIDAAATSVLYALEGTAPEIAPGQTITIWGDYRDTTDDRTLIGGLDRVVPIVTTTDYLGNSQADGLGSNLTSDLSVVTSDFATTAKFEVTNGGSQTVFLTRLQIRGKRVLDIGVQTFQSGSTSDRRHRPLLIDLPLQADPHVGQSAADYVRQQYGDARSQIAQLEYMPNYSAELLQQFMELEIGDRVTVTEEQAGLSEVDAIIMSIECDIAGAMTLQVRYGLAPAAPMQFWQWGIVGASEWGETTVYAF